MNPLACFSTNSQLPSPPKTSAHPSAIKPPKPARSHTFGISLALAAGASLPSKADAVVIVNENPVSTVDDTLLIEILFDPVSGTIFVSNIAGCITESGWLIAEYGGTFMSVAARSFNSIRHYFLATNTGFGGIMSFSDPPPALDLASPGSGYVWSDASASFYPLPAPGTNFFFGLRYTDLDSGDSWYGWTELEIGSIDHIRTAFETQANTGITLGQVPEPASAALLVTGLAGITTFRRRRSKD